MDYSRFLRRFTSTSRVVRFRTGSGIGVVNDKIYVNHGSGAVLLADEVASYVTTTNVGTAESGVTAVEYGYAGIFHQTILTLTAKSVTVADASAGGGTKIYTFPQGIITMLGGTLSLAPTTTSIIDDTLNGGSTIEVGIGTATAGAGALTTTEEDIVTGATGPSSTVINVAAAAIASARTIAPATHDGHTTALPIYLNVGVPTATDIDADATVLFSGTVTLTWIYGGDF